MKNKYSSFVSSEFIVGRGSLDYISQLKKNRAVVIYDDRVITTSNKKRINNLIVDNGGACKFILDIKNEPYLRRTRRSVPGLARHRGEASPARLAATSRAALAWRTPCGRSDNPTAPRSDETDAAGRLPAPARARNRRPRLRGR